MKIIAEVSKLSDTWFRPVIYCVGDDGTLDQAASRTLLDLVAETMPTDASKLMQLLAAAENGTYEPNDPGLPDWGVNDKNIWLRPPETKQGYVLISNENIPAYSSDDGQPQEFLIEQFRAALKHWLAFCELVKSQGKENLIGKKFEAVI